jgi:hypothetical protein
MTHKNMKKSRIFMFLSTGCSLLRAEGFSCSLGFLYGGLGISKLQFLIKKIEIKFPVIFFSNFRSSNPGSGSAIRKNAGSGSVSRSALNQCGSETLFFRYPVRCLSWLTNSALVYEPKCGGRGGGSCGVSANEYSCTEELK